ncbi:EamA family transporter RarD [Congregibacter litoralis]|uniref:RarD protein n=1 Tax=Congregibacter litoralis KT71 TaxID=314285 RepID=A4ADK0_9GAMM|nr:EamA family transporter RarD [Congregibacter litoralis]EAQ95889.1 rarD protein [Congregibacter litoralis KT71]
MKPEEQQAAELRSGIFFGLAAYGLWGVFPIYFKLLETVTPTEILLHRIVWAVPFGALIITLRRQWTDVANAFRDPRVIAWLALSALCISGNWFVYIWGVVNERIFEASLGYYINPLMYVAVGVLFFGERLRRAQLLAVALATIGVLVLSVQGSGLPWVSLSLAALFTAYGIIRKRVAIAAMPGLFAETALLFPLAGAGLLWLMLSHRAEFAAADGSTNMLLLLSGPITVFPLLFFAVAARRLTLTTVGFMQFLAPTMQFFIAMYFGEPFTTPRMICFALIWAAVIVFSVDALHTSRKRPPIRPGAG